MSDADSFVIILSGTKIISSASLKNHRITWIGVDKEYSGKRLGSYLFAQVKILNHLAWVSIGLEHNHVRKAAIEGGFQPITCESELKERFISVGKDPDKSVFSSLINTKDIDIHGLTGVLTFSKQPGHRSDYGHDNSYIQLLLKA